LQPPDVIFTPDGRLPQMSGEQAGNGGRHG
jgi:hypothetical protein